MAKVRHLNLPKARPGNLTSLFCLLGSIFLLSACKESAGFNQIQFVGPTMGTEYHVNVVVRKGDIVDENLDRLITERLRAISQSMSTYIADSELSLINSDQSQQWLKVSDQLFEVLWIAQQVSRLSAGAFDITIAPLVNLWGFGPDYLEEGQIPSEIEVAALLQQVGFEHLELNSESKTIKKNQNLTLDLSAIAKGYAADDLGRLLQSLGYQNYMVEIGGELALKGHNVQGTAWRIGIESPSLTHAKVNQAIAVSDVGVATSGNYRNYFERDGQRYSHAIDPITGKPITHNLASVTVVANSAAEADALATAINVLGYSAGKAMAEKNQLAVYFIIKRGDKFVSDYTANFSRYLTKR